VGDFDSIFCSSPAACSEVSQTLHQSSKPHITLSAIGWQWQLLHNISVVEGLAMLQGIGLPSTAPFFNTAAQRTDLIISQIAFVDVDDM